MSSKNTKKTEFSDDDLELNEKNVNDYSKNQSKSNDTKSNDFSIDVSKIFILAWEQ